MNKLIIGSILSATMLWGGSFSWVESVQVVRSKPVYRTVTIREPYEICRDERVPVTYYEMEEVPAALIGGAAGGVLGHQIGKGHGRDAATIGGALVGALMGANIARQHRRVRYTTRRVCETRYRTHRERRFIHYKNIAWYQGRRIVKFSQRPLRRIRVRLTARY